MQVTLTKDGISNSNRTFAAGDVVDFPPDRAIKIVEHGDGTFVDAKYATALSLYRSLANLSPGSALTAIYAALP